MSSNEPPQCPACGRRQWPVIHSCRGIADNPVAEEFRMNDNDRDQLREALAQTLYESMNDYLRLWGDLEDERRKTWLIHADALLPVVERYATREAAEGLRSAAAWIPGPEEWHNGSETYDELMRRAAALDPS